MANPLVLYRDGDVEASPTALDCAINGDSSRLVEPSNQCGHPGATAHRRWDRRWRGHPGFSAASAVTAAVDGAAGIPGVGSVAVRAYRRATKVTELGDLLSPCPTQGRAGEI